MSEPNGIGPSEGGGIAAVIATVLGVVTNSVRTASKAKANETRLNDHAKRIRDMETKDAVMAAQLSEIDRNIVDVRADVKALLARK